MHTIFTLLVLLQIKHWYIDFVNQTPEEVKYKGVFLDIRGIKHSFKQGLGTFVALCIWLILMDGTIGKYLPYIFILSFADFVLHYHIDWTKMNYGNRDITTPAFWNHLGLDQMAHQFCYLGIAFLSIPG